MNAPPAGADYFETLASEHDMMLKEAAARMREAGGCGDVPLTVIASGAANPMFGDSAAVFQRFWIDESRKLAERSGRGSFILAAESGHNLYRDAPDVVVRAIRALTARAR